MIKRQVGFTIVELIVVITTIGILAGITTVGYGEWQQSLAIKEIESGAEQLRAAMQDELNFATDGQYPTVLPTSFTNPGETGVTTTIKGRVTFTLANVAGGLEYCARLTTVSPSFTYYIKPPSVTAPTTALPSGCIFT